MKQRRASLGSLVEISHDIATDAPTIDSKAVLRRHHRRISSAFQDSKEKRSTEKRQRKLEKMVEGDETKEEPQDKEDAPAKTSPLRSFLSSIDVFSCCLQWLTSWFHEEEFDDLEEDPNLDALLRRPSTIVNIGTILATSEPEKVTGKHLFIISGGSKTKLAWDVLLMFVLVVIAFTTPFQLAFFTDSDWADPTVKLEDTLLEIFFFTDIVINFRTTYVEPSTGEEVFNYKDIAWRYIKGWFLIDFVSTVPWENIVGLFITNMAGNQDLATQIPKLIKVVRIVRLMKLVRLAKVQKMLDYIEDQFDISRNLFRFASLCLILLLASHFGSCFFYALAWFSPEVDDPSWVDYYGFSNSSTYERYIISTYAAISNLTPSSHAAMLTIGFGDIVGHTDNEKTWSLFVMIIGAGSYGFLVASMASIVNELGAMNNVFNSKISLLNKFMESKQLPRELRIRLRQYYKFFLARKNVHEESFIVNELSSQLQKEVLFIFINKTMKQIPILAVASPEVSKHIIANLQPLFFGPEEIVFEEGDHAAEMFFLFEGSAIVVSRNVNGPTLMDNLPLNTLLKGEIFGEMALFVEEQSNKRCASVLTTSFCDLFTIDADIIVAEAAKDEPLLREILKVALMRRKVQKFRAKQYALVEEKKKAERESKWKTIKGKFKPKQLLSSEGKGSEKMAMLKSAVPDLMRSESSNQIDDMVTKKMNAAAALLVETEEVKEVGEDDLFSTLSPGRKGLLSPASQGGKGLLSPKRQESVSDMLDSLIASLKSQAERLDMRSKVAKLSSNKDKKEEE